MNGGDNEGKSSNWNVSDLHTFPFALERIRAPINGDGPMAIIENELVANLPARPDDIESKSWVRSRSCNNCE